MVAQAAGPHVVEVPEPLWSAAAKAAVERTTLTAILVDALTNYTARYTGEQVVGLLVAEGHEPARVRAVFTSLITAGLPVDQTEYHALVSAAELEQLRQRLATQAPDR